MTTAQLATFLLWCLGINYFILILWFVVFRFARTPLYRLHTHWFRLSPEYFDLVHYSGMAFYKVVVLIFVLTPWLALQLMH